MKLSAEELDKAFAEINAGVCEEDVWKSAHYWIAAEDKIRAHIATLETDLAAEKEAHLGSIEMLSDTVRGLEVNLANEKACLVTACKRNNKAESNLATSEAARERAEELVLVHRERYRATCKSDCPTDCLDRFEAEAIFAHAEEGKG